MEELVSKFERLVDEGDRMFSRGDYSGAYKAYLNALYSLAAMVVYNSTGMLVPPERLPGFLGEFPELEGAIRKYSGVPPGEETVRSLKEDIERLRGMMSLPSSER